MTTDEIACAALATAADWGTLPVAPWNPWAALADLPGWRVVRDVELPGRTWGLSIPSSQGGGLILVCKLLGPRAQTTTLAHELIHVERGIRRFDTAEAHQAEEEAVEVETVRRLIPAENLAAAVGVMGLPDDDDESALLDMARYLGVAVPDVEARLRTISDDEWRAVPPQVVPRATEARRGHALAATVGP